MLCLVVQLVSRKQFQHIQRHLLLGCPKKISLQEVIVLPCHGGEAFKTKERLLRGQLNPRSGLIYNPFEWHDKLCYMCMFACTCTQNTERFLLTFSHSHYVCQGHFLSNRGTQCKHWALLEAFTGSPFLNSAKPAWGVKEILSCCCLFYCGR